MYFKSSKQISLFDFGQSSGLELNPNNRWVKMAHVVNWDKIEDKQQEDLPKICKQYPKLGRAYRMVQVFKDIFSFDKSREQAEIETKKWLGWAARCQLEPIKKFAETVKSHWEGFMHYFDSRITNGIAEGINSVIQSIKRSARGYKNKEYFRTMIYLRLADLPLPQPQ